MPLEFALDYDRGLPVYRQIYEAVLHALASGQLERDEQLPTISELARQLAINPNTVARSYRELERDGYVVGQRGRGTFPTPTTVKTRDKTRVLRAIFEDAIAKAAKHNLSAEDVVRFFRKANA